MKFFKESLKDVRAFVFDMDGVLSRHEMVISPEGHLLRTSCTKDGYAIMYSVKKGYVVAIISGGYAPGVRERLERLGVKDIFLGIADKVAALNELMERYQLKSEEVLYMGDDIPDYLVMTKVGVPVCPSDACDEIKAAAAYVSDIKGGMGCVRDVISQVMKARGDWMDTSCMVKSI